MMKKFLSAFGLTDKGTNAPCIDMRCLSLIVGLSFSTGSLFLWWALHAAESTYIQQTVEQKAEALNTEITEQIEPQILALVRMSRHWEQEGGLSRENWEMNARTNLEDFKGYQAIAWVDPSARVRWIVPLENRSTSQDLSHDFAQHQTALETARRTGRLVIIPRIDLVGREKGFLVVMPTMENHQLVGFMVGVFQTHALFNTLLDDSDIQDYAIQVFDHAQQLYSRHATVQTQNPAFVQRTTITLHELNWQVYVAPTRALLGRMQSYLPEVSLFSGLSLSWMLALAIYLAQSSDRTAKSARKTALQLQISNQELEHEIYERQQAEHLLQATQKHLEHVLSCSPLIIYSFTLEGQGGVTYVSQNIEVTFGYRAEMFLKDPNFWIDHVHPEDVPRVLANRPALLQKERASYEYRFLHLDGKYRWVFDDLRVVRGSQGQVVEIVGSMQDITSRKQAEEQTKKAQDFLQTVVNNVPVALFVKDGRPQYFGQFKLWNKTSEQIFGISAKDAIGSTDSDFFPPEQAEFFYEKDIETFAKGVLEDIPEEPVQSQNLGDRILHTIKVPIFNELHEPEYLLCISQDITEKKEAETLLQQSLQELADFKFALDASSIVAITDGQGIIQYVNDKFCEVSRYNRTELIGQNHRIIDSQYHPREFFVHLWATITRGDIWKGEICNCSKNGELYWVDTTIVPLIDSAGKPTQYIAVNIDITEKKILEKQFLRVQRMESLGTLAGGIAHDLNNVLAPIMMATQLLKVQDQDEPTQQWLEIMEGSAKRGADLVKQVLSFARGMDGEHITLQVHSIIHEIHHILEEIFPKDITLRVDVPADLWPVRGDTTQLHQVLMNLCINARDAMPGGGVLSITARNVRIDDSPVRTQLDAAPGSYVEIAVVDTGMGIPAAILDRIFEPFFTTKDFGKGTGMGLSTVIGIIKSHRGTITVSSQPGQETQFKVYIPSAQTTLLEPTDEGILPEGRSELILVVDDELAICNIARASLQAHHYRVLTANSGAQAIALYTQHANAISLVLMDMMMPEMDGLATMQKLRQMNSGLRFVIMSGLISGMELSEVVDASTVVFLPKPFTTHELITTLSQALDVANGTL
ncbi:PAS domain S-box protein [Leptolyngbya sp. FACHB-8]|uniref:PAS domain S-box protein n=1 Tax=unclassified Leptolyngbya TaxID=2650499 RepID=UPI0016873C6E|nr:PAS domain S-box protein [Leptolyngbya sp. FACHB-8]MBD1910793.1 PAS domain S-box protein [Leptolyngbya sp. FACHB-8]